MPPPTKAAQKAELNDKKDELIAYYKARMGGYFAGATNAVSAGSTFFIVIGHFHLFIATKAMQKLATGRVFAGPQHAQNAVPEYTGPWTSSCCSTQRTRHACTQPCLQMTLSVSGLTCLVAWPSAKCRQLKCTAWTGRAASGLMRSGSCRRWEAPAHHHQKSISCTNTLVIKRAKCATTSPRACECTHTRAHTAPLPHTNPTGPQRCPRVSL